MNFLEELNSLPISQLSPAGFQRLNWQIYHAANDIFYSKQTMASVMQDHGAQVAKRARKWKLQDIPYHDAMTFSRAVGLANMLHMDIGSELWRRFPGVCPYCGHAPCLGPLCKNGTARRKRKIVPSVSRPHTLHGFQEMFARIYPYNLRTLKVAAPHLLEETVEVNTALRDLGSRNDPKDLEEARLELTDVITTTFAVANAMRFSLAQEMEKWFSRGCPGCHKSPCTCGYAIMKNGELVRKK